MQAYLVLFAVDLWVSLHGILPSLRRTREIAAIARDVTTTDAGPLEALTLLNIAAWESGFDRGAVGKSGERGAFQVHPPATSYGAAEALRRLRSQGIMGYMGCSRETERCREMAERRTLPAKVFFWSHEPPSPGFGELATLEP